MGSLIQNAIGHGWWQPGEIPPETGNFALQNAVRRVGRSIHFIQIEGRIGVGYGGTLFYGDPAESHCPENGRPLLASVPPLSPDTLGDPLFKKAHRLKYPYIAGAMAHGLTSVEMVEAMARGGMLGFLGAAGLSPDEIETAIERLQNSLGNLPFGINLIHSPNDPQLESALVRMFIDRGIRRISASAFMDLTLPLVYYRVRGIHTDPQGNIVCPNQIIAKVSRIEVATKFFLPPPEKLLSELVQSRMISAGEAELAGRVPMADDVTAEADSGGHTDNRPAISMLPTMISLRDHLVSSYNYPRIPGIGLGGGVSTPQSAAAAFAMGAAFVVTGSVNHSCVEAGTSDVVRKMLTEARQADVTMAPSADMFELGAKVQVLKRGTLFPLRAAKLYDLYNRYTRYEDIPLKQRTILERDIFRCTFEEEWHSTRAFFGARDPRQIERAEKDPRHKMSLVFRSYLGRSSRWAQQGDPTRKIDYQVWCGPAMGAFNEWVKGSFLESPEQRRVVPIAMNLLWGACVATRIHWIRAQGIELPHEITKIPPLPLSQLLQLMDRSQPDEAAKD